MPFTYFSQSIYRHAARHFLLYCHYQRLHEDNGEWGLLEARRHFCRCFKSAGHAPILTMLHEYDFHAFIFTSQSISLDIILPHCSFHMPHTPEIPSYIA